MVGPLRRGHARQPTPPGSGSIDKLRLALPVAAALANGFAFVDQAPLEEPAQTTY